MPDDLCSAKGPEEWYASTLTILGIIGGLGLLVGYNAVNFFSSRYGRKPAMFGVLMLALSSKVFLITSPYMSPLLEVVWLILWQLLESLSGFPLMTFLVNLYVVDMVSAETRTVMLSLLNGWAVLGDAVSFTAGGNITTYTNEYLPVYYIAMSINVLVVLYLLFVLPESFTKEKRVELQRERVEEDSQRTASLSHLPPRKRVFHRMASYLGPFKILKPTWNEQKGRRNWRLLVCAVHVFVSSLGAGYVTLAMVVFLTSQYHYKPADTGYALALYSFTSATVLTFAIPFVFRILRPLYRRASRGQEPALRAQQDDADNETTSEASDRLDVHVTVVSWLIEAVGYILVAHIPTRLGQYSSIVFLGFSAARNPVLRSLVAASVEPLKQGEALTAIEMVGSIAMFISPIILGTILTAYAVSVNPKHLIYLLVLSSSTISTMPTLVFWVNFALVLLASLVLLLVRDSDRYQKPHEE
ncbi:hypothetical protein V5O48_004890 [Marasmius crinis-equi]|uniref:Uncharacterized protein n=1 Tax=Marasmius crinis-equi TaxID=585013 RepID=A0ABR3FP94_9AGAR